MTISVAALAAAAGILFGERIGARQILGLGLGAAAVLLIASP
jgi:drug/metabolite transporter (DMT)-like permease